MKKNVIDTKDDFVELINKKKKISAIILGIIVLFIVSLFIFIPKIQANIRNSEINYLFDKVNLNKKVSFFVEEDITKQIEEKNAITILFSEPHGKEYNKVLTVFSDNNLMNTFNHSLFIYPIVYNSNKIEKKYGINKNEVTIVFFENGNEKNRFIVVDSLDVNKLLITKLNELPLSMDTTPVQTSQQTTSSQQQTETTTTSSAQEEGVAVESNEVPVE